MRTFLVYLDLLGFKALFNKQKSSELHRIVKNCIQDFNKTIMKSLECPDVKNGRNVIGHERIKGFIEFRLLSDSILIWCRKSNELSFCIITEAVQQLLFWGLKNGMPLRGVLTYGDLFLYNPSERDKEGSPINNEAIFGKALIQAYTLESEMHWSGCIITPQAWTKLKKIWKGIRIPTDSPNGLFNYIPRLVWYGVPFKGDQSKSKPLRYIRCIAIDWNTDLYGQKLQEDDFGRCFLSEQNDVLLKKSETQKFFSYTKKLHLLYDNVKNLCKIPVPTDNYTIRGIRHRGK